MKVIEIIEKIDSWSMNPPKLYGWFHILFLLLTIGATIFLCYFFRNSSTKTMKIICLISEIVLVVFEIIKQLINSHVEGGFIYDWESFPFQFCETPMYILPIIIFSKNKKVHDVLISYMATFAMFAGLTIMICPSTVLNSSIFSNVRALIQHAIQVIIGIYLMVWNRKNFTLKDFLYSSILFIALCFVAIAINIIVEDQTGAAMTMFYLSRSQESAILIIRLIKPYVPFPIYVLSYIVGFSICAFLTYMVEQGVYCFFKRKREKQSTC